MPRCTIDIVRRGIISTASEGGIEKAEASRTAALGDN
jgi:hypothetical protein